MLWSDDAGSSGSLTRLVVRIDTSQFARQGCIAFAGCLCRWEAAGRQGCKTGLESEAGRFAERASCKCRSEGIGELKPSWEEGVCAKT